MNHVLNERSIVNSALWAAYGDALGFITELADEGRVEHRSGASKVEQTIPWRRKLGARSSVYVEFPAGTYSDDTQLRLSVSRCIRANGTFDVASFAKVELTAWLNYALGAGLSSREAAANLARTSATWYSNFFSGKRARYVESGGNGAAMRIQPHVWALRNRDDHVALYRDVIKDTICSHGHPRAIVGACFHAATLNFALRMGRAADIAELWPLLRDLRKLEKVVLEDNDLRLLWVDQWTAETGENFSEAINRTVDEMERDIKVLDLIDVEDVADGYHRALFELGALEPTMRGSATKTAILANYVALIARPWSVERVIKLVANALGSDTDSIGTMAGAILGAYGNTDVAHDLQDREYIVQEARRLYRVSQGQEARSFGYPDLRSWKPERAAIDAIIRTDEGLILNGIARAGARSEPIIENDGSSLQWLRLAFGQTILAKIREVPRMVHDASAFVIRERTHQPTEQTQSKLAPRMPDLFSPPIAQGGRNHSATPAPPTETESLNLLLERVIASGFDPALVGNLILKQAGDDRSDFVERGIALTSTILTAYRARSRRR